MTRPGQAPVEVFIIFAKNRTCGLKMLPEVYIGVISRLTLPWRRRQKMKLQSSSALVDLSNSILHYEEEKTMLQFIAKDAKLTLLIQRWGRQRTLELMSCVNFLFIFL